VGLAGSEKVVDACCNEFTVITMITHPDVILGLGWEEFWLPECISEAFVPTESTALKSMQGLRDEEGVTFLVAKLWSLCDAQILLGAAP
jgi:hypothetical protein